ncbi:MAG: hypothetical protein WA584_07815 [Pyrinomonadaceae bacterium]
MAHIIEVVRECVAESAFVYGRAFLFGLRFRQLVIAINWNADVETELG